MNLVLEFTRAESAGDPFAFRPGEQTYLLRSAGGASRPLTLRWDEALLQDLASLRDPERGGELRQKLGETLRAVLLPAGWAALEPEIGDALARGEPLHIAVRSGAAELYALPWELLVVGVGGQSLAELPGLALSYEWPETRTAPVAPDPPREGGRVLLVASAAGGAIPLDAHAMHIARACAAAGVRFDPARDVVSDASLSSIADALDAARAADDPVRVVHLLAHGQRAGAGYGVALHGATVDATALRGVLAKHADMVRCVVLAVCDAGSAGAPGAWLSSVAQALHRAGIAAVLASRAPLSVAGSIGMTGVLYQSLLVDMMPVAEAVRAVRLAELRAGRIGDALALQLHAREADLSLRPVVFRPYRGLLAFTPSASRFFAGRDDEVRALTSRVQRAGRGEAPRLIVLSGPSACGKTSLVMGGVVPNLEKSTPPWEISVVRMDRAHTAELDQVGLGRAAPGPLLLVVDQLEEALDGAADALRKLWALSRTPGSRVVVLLPLRIDLLGPLGALLLSPQGPRFDKVAYDPEQSLFLAQLSQEGLAATIREPARRVGVAIDEGLITAILAEIGDTPAPLPLLEVALDALWQRRVHERLDPAVWREMGGFSGALSKAAEQAWSSLAQEEQDMARRLLIRMVQPGEGGLPPTRKRLDLDALDSSNAALVRALEHLIDARLVSSGDAETDPEHGRWAELAHDALLRAWPRLRDWVEEERGKLHEIDRLTREFEAFKASRGTDAEREHRLSGGRLIRAKELCTLYGEELPAELRRWVVECTRRARMRAQWGRIAALGVAVLAALVALSMGRLAQTARQEREVARSLLYERELIAARVQLAAGQDRQAVQTALRAWAMTQKGEIQPQNAEVLAGLLSELMHAVTLRATVQGHARAVSALSTSPDGRRVASGSLDGTVALWGFDGAKLAAPDPLGHAVTAIAFSADGQTLLIGTELGRVCRWTPGQPRCIDQIASGRAVVGLAETLDGRLIAGTIDGRVVMHNVDGTTQTLLEPAEGALNGLSLGPDGAIATGEDGEVRLLLPDGALLTLPIPGERAVAVRFRPGRPDQLAIATDGLRLWSRDAPLPEPLVAHLGGVRALGFLPDGKAIVSLGGDDALVWHRMVKAPGRRIDSGRVGGTALAVGAEGQLVSGTSSGELLFRATTPGFVRSSEGHKGAVLGAAWVSAEQLVTAGEDGRLYSVRENASLLDEGVAFTALIRGRDDQLITARMDGRVQQWSLTTGLATALCQASATPRGLALVPDGVAWAGEYGAVGVCQAGAARELLPPGPGRDATALEVTGSTLLVTLNDGSLARVALDGTSEVLPSSGSALTAIVALGEGYVTGGGDGVLRWSDGRTLRLDGGAIFDLDLRADGLLAVASSDGAVRLVRDGALYATRRLHDGPVRTVAFSDDGTQLATGGDDRLLRISPVWLDDPAPWVERACDWLGGAPEGCE